MEGFSTWLTILSFHYYSCHCSWWTFTSMQYSNLSDSWPPPSWASSVILLLYIIVNNYSFKTSTSSIPTSDRCSPYLTPTICSHHQNFQSIDPPTSFSLMITSLTSSLLSLSKLESMVHHYKPLLWTSLLPHEFKTLILVKFNSLSFPRLHPSGWIQLAKNTQHTEWSPLNV